MSTSRRSGLASTLSESGGARSAAALVTMIGSEARFSSARSRATSSQPVITGIIRSVSTTEGMSPSRRRSMATAPFLAPTTS
jgi:hypothetical protein